VRRSKGDKELQQSKQQNSTVLHLAFTAVLVRERLREEGDMKVIMGNYVANEHYKRASRALLGQAAYFFPRSGS
jgi:hypothetical protein